jgi:hypothetical protein
MKEVLRFSSRLVHAFTNVTWLNLWQEISRGFSNSEFLLLMHTPVYLKRTTLLSTLKIKWRGSRSLHKRAPG